MDMWCSILDGIKTNNISILQDKVVIHHIIVYWGNDRRLHIDALPSKG